MAIVNLPIYLVVHKWNHLICIWTYNIFIQLHAKTYGSHATTRTHPRVHFFKTHTHTHIQDTRSQCNNKSLNLTRVQKHIRACVIMGMRILELLWIEGIFQETWRNWIQWKTIPLWAFGWWNCLIGILEDRKISSIFWRITSKRSNLMFTIPSGVWMYFLSSSIPSLSNKSTYNLDVPLFFLWGVQTTICAISMVSFQIPVFQSKPSLRM